MQLTDIPDIFREAFKEWNKDDASLLAAALAYYGLFSLVPLLVILMIILNALFGHGLLGGSNISQAQDLASRQMPGNVGDMLNRAGGQAASYRFTLLSFLVLVLGAAGLFVQTKRAFRIIWSQECVEETLGSWHGQVLSPLLFAHPPGGISAFSFSGCDSHPLALQRVHRGSTSSSSGDSPAGDLSYVHFIRYSALCCHLQDPFRGRAELVGCASGLCGDSHPLRNG